MATLSLAMLQQQWRCNSQRCNNDGVAACNVAIAMVLRRCCCNGVVVTAGHYYNNGVVAA
jgi:hypothetical protein